MKIKTMIFTTFKLIAAFIPAIIVIILLIPIRIAQFLWHFFKMAYLFLWIRNRRRKMPLIIINKNGIDLEKNNEVEHPSDGWTFTSEPEEINGMKKYKVRNKK